MSNELSIGQIISNKRQVDRDAIHVAVIPLIAMESLDGGDWVKIVREGGVLRAKKVREAFAERQAHGIVDPFLREDYVQEGDRFWCFLRPGTVDGMRHHWRWPLIDETPAEKSEHETWIRNFCDEWHFDYDDLIENATAEPGGGHCNHITSYGRDLHDADELGADHDLFWMHLEKLTGLTFNSEHREKFIWSCTC